MSTTQISRGVSGPQREYIFELRKLASRIIRYEKFLHLKGLDLLPLPSSNIVRGEHRYPYQMKNVIKLRGIFFLTCPMFVVVFKSQNKTFSFPRLSSSAPLVYLMFLYLLT